MEVGSLQHLCWSHSPPIRTLYNPCSCSFYVVLCSCYVVSVLSDNIFSLIHRQPFQNCFQKGIGHLNANIKMGQGPLYMWYKMIYNIYSIILTYLLYNASISAYLLFKYFNVYFIYTHTHAYYCIYCMYEVTLFLSLEKPNVLLNFSHKKLHQGFLAVLPWTLLLKTPVLL